MADRQHTTGKAKGRSKSLKHSALVGHSNKAHKIVEKHTGRKATSKSFKVRPNFPDELLRRGARDTPRSRPKGFQPSVIPGNLGKLRRNMHEFIEHPEAKSIVEILRTAQEGRMQEFAASERNLQEGEGSLQTISDLLGGSQILGTEIKSDLDAHELLHQGLPRAALRSLVDKIHLITTDEAFEALGVSLRTLQRHKSEPDALLDVQQSGRAWKFAEILAKATRVLGSQNEAEQWLRRPAIGLDQRRPVDLLTTPAGVKLVEDYLGRLEYDVYT
jgi:putative toxin-antitoxin system antitoxin component (TIGR02293 family)